LAGDPRNGYVYALYENGPPPKDRVPPTVTYMLNRSSDAGATWSLGGNPNGIVIDTRTSHQGKLCACKFATVRLARRSR
jgi:hypothetical protein